MLTKLDLMDKGTNALDVRAYYSCSVLMLDIIGNFIAFGLCNHQCSFLI